MTESPFVPSEALIKLAQKYAEENKTDVCIYNGPIRRLADVAFMQTLTSNKRFDRLLLILVTNGGDADAAYKMARFIQSIYGQFTVFVTGMCKSAGTLLALGANEIVFSPYGELGPLDVQKGKEDRVGFLQSGLVVTEALRTLENRATTKYFELISAILGSSSTISFSLAAKAAADVLHGLYAPIFSQIDPEDVGDRARSNRIGIDYGKRLAIRGCNLKEKTLDTIVKSYSSHSFVIDQTEASLLFNNVRTLTKDEAILMSFLGDHAIFQQRNLSETPIIEVISKVEKVKKENKNDKHKGEGSPAKASRNTTRAARPATVRTKRTRVRLSAGKNEGVVTSLPRKQQ